MRGLSAVVLPVLVIVLAACGSTSSPRVTGSTVTTDTSPIYADNPAITRAAGYGWNYWSYTGSSYSFLPTSLVGARYASSCTSSWLGKRCDGVHGSGSSFTPEPTDPSKISQPRFSLYKPYFWNGRLIVFAKGYGQADAPLRLPNAWGSGFNDLLNLFLLKGYGVAWTSCSENGYAVADCAALTDQLKAFWETRMNSKRTVARTYLAGGSMGGQVVQSLAEKSTKYKGALATCGVLGGSVRQAKYIFDVRNLFDHYFRNTPTLPLALPGRADGYTLDGNVLTPINPASIEWGNGPGPLSGWPAKIDATVRANESLARQVAVARATGPSGDFSDRRIALRPDGTESTDFISEFSDWMRWVMFFQLKGSEDMLFRSGGNPENNTGVTYYTGGAPINEVSVYTTAPGSYDYLKANYEPTGKPLIKMISLHNQYDPAAPDWHNDVYQAEVSAGSYASNFVRMTAKSYGHCNFTQDQITYAFDQLVAWAEDTKRPYFQPDPSGLPQ